MMSWNVCSEPGKENNMERNVFMKKLKLNKSRLTIQQYRTLKGQALAGNVDAADKGLGRLLKRGAKDAH